MEKSTQALMLSLLFGILSNQNEGYIAIFLGIIGIAWVILSLVNIFLEHKEEKNKQNPNQ